MTLHIKNGGGFTAWSELPSGVPLKENFKKSGAQMARHGRRPRATEDEMSEGVPRPPDEAIGLRPLRPR